MEKEQQTLKRTGKKIGRGKSRRSEVHEKVMIVILLLLTVLCLTDLPDIVSQIVRSLAFAGYLYMGYLSVRGGRWGFTVLYLLLALVFQPFYMFGIGQQLWVVIDIVVIVTLLYSLYRAFKSKIKK